MNPQFSISNQCSANLNYLIYIYTIYSNKNNNKKKFPFFPYDNYGFLKYETFKANFITLWNDIINKCKNFPNHAMWDLYYFNNRDSYYKILFQDSSDGEQKLRETWDSFFVWWNQENYGGQFVLNKLTDELISDIYIKLRSMFQESGIYVPLKEYFIQIVYDNIQDNCIDFSTSFIIVPIQKLLPPSDVNVVITKMYKNIVDSNQ